MSKHPDPLHHQITVDAGAAFTCDFAIANNVSPANIVPMSERDRTVMAARPGFLRKFIPLRIDPASGNWLRWALFVPHDPRRPPGSVMALP